MAGPTNARHWRQKPERCDGTLTVPCMPSSERWPPVLAAPAPTGSAALAESDNGRESFKRVTGGVRLTKVGAGAPRRVRGTPHSWLSIGQGLYYVKYNVFTTKHWSLGNIGAE